jgi:hypothetical protein
VKNVRPSMTLLPRSTASERSTQRVR